MYVKLGSEQEEALNKIQNFIRTSKNTAFSLTGAAGTGKTLCIKYLIDWIEDNGYLYTLCAPTHKAALVLKMYTERNTNTLHKLLSLSPNIQILDLDLRELEFVTSKPCDNIPYNGVVICDEASMINDDLFDLLVEKVSERNTKIIFVSDPAQLIPVKQSKKAKVYNLEDSYFLTKIYRQSDKNSILPILQRLRSTEIGRLDSCSGEDGKLIVDTEMKEFLNKAINEIKVAINTKNILHTKIVAYTNKRIELYNQVVRKFIFVESIEYNKNEILTAYENGTCDGTQYYNSMDYFIISAEEVSRDLPYFTKVFGWELTLYDQYENSEFKIFIISRDHSSDLFEALAGTIETLRLRAIEAKKRKQRTSAKYWRMYYELIESFATPIDLFFDNRLIRKKSFDYGYATTVHKSQGSSYNNIFIDMRNIKTCKDSLVRRQLQYVALSRTRKDAFVLQ